MSTVVIPFLFYFILLLYYMVAAMDDRRSHKIKTLKLKEPPTSRENSLVVMDSNGGPFNRFITFVKDRRRLAM